MNPRSASRTGLYPAPPHPPPDTSYHYHRQGPGAVNRFHVPELQRLPPYEWIPPRSTPHIPPPPDTPTMTNGRKRQNTDYSPHMVKRQRLDSFPHALFDSPVIQALSPPHHLDQVRAESSRSSIPLYERSYSTPRFEIHPQGPAVPENSLQAYAKDKVCFKGFNLPLSVFLCRWLVLSVLLVFVPQLSHQMVELFEACQQQSSDLEHKERCRARLQKDIQDLYAVARLYLTGSSMNGLGCRSSDADLCLVIKGAKRPDPIRVLTHLQRAFRSLSYVERTQLIRAKVPILRFRERGSDLEFDLNINNTVGIRNTFLLRSYARADLRIRPMILVIKKWARHQQINDASKGTLSSYTLVLMVLHYLQTLKEPVLPSLQKDYPQCFSPFIDIDMVPEGSKWIPPYVSRNQSSLGELLVGFLRYYATEFRWDKQVISVREARALPKTNSHEWTNKYICVEEPFERNNVARAVHEKMKFDAIKAEFAESYRILKDRKDLNSILPVRAIINKESNRR